MDAAYFINFLSNHSAKAYTDHCIYDEVIILPSTISTIKSLERINLITESETKKILEIIDDSNSVIVPSISNSLWQEAYDLNLNTSLDNKLIISYINRHEIPALILNQTIKENIYDKF